MHRDHILIKAKGQVLIIAIIFLAVILILTATMFSKVSSFLRFGNISAQASQATALAEAGVDNTVWLLNTNGGNCPAACTTETTLGTIGTFKVTITDDPANPNIKTITSTGYIPNSINPRKKRTVKVQTTIDTQDIAFHYAAQAGEGGVYMSNSAQINGNLYSNGGIYYGGTGNQMTIDGDAYAVIAPIASQIEVTPGHNKYAPESPKDLPTVNYSYWQTEATKTNDIVTCSPTCYINTSRNIGPQKYEGNVEISGNIVVDVTGPIWITGDFTIGTGNAIVKLDDSFGSHGTVMLVNGKISYEQGGTFNTTNASPPGYILVVTTSTADDAIKIAQAGATAIFYALNGGAQLTQTADVISLVAYKLEMSQTAELTFNTGLASADFTSGPGASWVIIRGTYKQTGSP